MGYPFPIFLFATKETIFSICLSQTPSRATPGFSDRGPVNLRPEFQQHVTESPKNSRDLR
jgi:hypothetical protein